MKRFIIEVKDLRCEYGTSTRAINTDNFAEARKFAKKYQSKAITNTISVIDGYKVYTFKINDFIAL